MTFEELINAPGTLHICVIALFAVSVFWLFYMFFQPKVLQPYKDVLGDVVAMLSTVVAGLFIRKFGWKVNSGTLQ